MKKPASKSSLFLLELIFSIFFFSIASGVCIQLFVKAHFLGVETKELNQATIWSQNIAEAFYASDNINDMEKLFPFQQNESKNSYQLFFDQDWNPISTDGVVTYTLEVSIQDDSDYRYVLINIDKSNQANASGTSNDTQELYQLQLKKYIQNRSVTIHD